MSDGSASPTAPAPAGAGLALPCRRAVLRCHPRQSDGPGEPPPLPLDARAGHRLLGRGVHADGLQGRAALDDQSAFIASLGSNRSDRMRDVLGTIQAEQDAIIRAGSVGALVVDGGPGTGKTVVALHRTAYLLYSDPRLGHRRGGVLFVGPHQPYLAYVADVLPSLGEEGVQTCTLRDLVREGAPRGCRARPGGRCAQVVRGNGAAIEEAVRFYEEPPATGMTVRPPGRRSRSVPRIGRWRSKQPSRGLRTTTRASRSGRSCSRFSSTHDDDGAASPERLRQSLAAEPRSPRCFHPCVATRGGRRPRR